MGGFMNPCELVTFVSSLACVISKDKNSNELALLASVFSQLGDSLATIAVAKENK